MSTGFNESREKLYWGETSRSAGTPGRHKEDRLDAKEHTSLQRRLEQGREDPALNDAAVGPLRIDRATKRIVNTPHSALTLTLAEYRQQVEWTARHYRDHNRRDPTELHDPPSSMRDPQTWIATLTSFRRRTRRLKSRPRWMASVVPAGGAG